MRILGFDTATPATTVALLDTADGSEFELRDDPPPDAVPRHTAQLMPLIAQVLERADGGWGSIDRIAVGVGPGTFTGLRIGVATARALAGSRGVELVGVSTLQAMAYRAVTSDPEADSVLAAIDARRGEVFVAAWRVDRRVIEPRVLQPDGLATVINELDTAPLAVGSGAVKFRGHFERAGALVPADGSAFHNVDALAHCRLAAMPDAAIGAQEVWPQYLRLPDAELTRRRGHDQSSRT